MKDLLENGEMLLMGKVLGIGAMGLVQMSFWAILIAAGTTFSGTIIAMIAPADAVSAIDGAVAGAPSQAEILESIGFTVPDLGPEVFIFFVLYFLLGYLLYATLFAGIGSSVEQQQDAQSLMLPVMMPIIVSIIFLQAVIEAPNSTLSVVLSILPFTAPIPMVVRIAMIDVPWWHSRFLGGSDPWSGGSWIQCGSPCCGIVRTWGYCWYSWQGLQLRQGSGPP